MELVAQFVGSIVTKIGEYTVAQLGRQFDYLKGDLNSLQNQSQELKTKKDALQQRVDAKKNEENILPDVKQWLTEAEKCYQLARTLEHENEANKWCLKWCPNLKFRYSLGKKAKKLAEEMQKLHERGNFPQVSTPKPPPPVPPVEVIFEKGNKSFVSRVTVMENVMQALKDDKIRVIGICGMGGVGKTSMAQTVIERAKEWKLFDKAVMVSVSKTKDVWKIQDDIAFFLKIKMPEDAKTIEARACCLLEGIKEMDGTKNEEKEMDVTKKEEKEMDVTKKEEKEMKGILIVLDDIWKELKLNEIGIPFKEDHKGCKILLTSRIKEAVRNTGAHSDHIFVVAVLDEDEAWSLFKEEAGISEGSKQAANLLPTQMAVAKECKGLPLALVVVGKALRDKDRNSWEYARQQLQQAVVDNLGDVEEHVYKSLKYSYDQLKSEETKKCFLLCSMYPEDYDIPVEDLVRYGFADKLFKGTKRVGEARHAAYYTVNTLKNCHLLLDGVDEEHVKVHDMVRDVAISIASKEKHPFIYDDEVLKDSSEDEHKRYAVISLQHLGEYTLISNLAFPKLWLFRLTCGGGLLEIPNNFYQGMEKLKVVALSNISFRSLPTSLGSLSNLHTLSVEKCEVNGNMSVIGELKSLEILSLKCSKVKELPVEMENLTRLKLLDLYECKIDMIAPGILSSLSNLEEIYIGEVRKPLSEHIRELSSLSNLMALGISLVDHHLWPRNWSLEKMKNFDINLGYDDFTRERYKLNNQLQLKEIDVSSVKESGLRNIVKSSEVLGLCSIRGLEDIFYDLGEDNFENLTSLTLEDCETIEHLINATHGDPQRAFPVIETLQLENLKRLRTIRPTQQQAGSSNATTSSFSNTEVVFATLKELWLRNLPELIGKPLWKYEYDHHQKQLEGSGPIKIDWLSNLKNLSLTSCGKLESLFIAPVARGLVQLQEIYIDGCELLEAIVIPSEGGYIHNVEKGTIGGGGEEEEIMFPKLQELYLRDLQCFSSFSKVNAAIKMPKLKKLDLYHLPKITSLPPTTTNNNHCPVIQSCFNKVTFSVLGELQLTQLPELIGRPLWKYEYDHHQQQQEVPTPIRSGWLKNLTSLELQECDKLESVFSELVARYLVQLEKLLISKCKKLEAIVVPDEDVGMYKVEKATMEKEEIIFPKLQDLVLQGLPCFMGFDKVGTAIEMPQLKKLELFDLPEITSLCPPPPFPLTTPVIQSCFNKTIEAIVIPNEGEDIYKEKEATAKEKEVIFPKLQGLVLRGLPCFASFYEVKTTIEMPQLKKFELFDLPMITSLCLPSIPPMTTNSNYDPIFQSCFNKVVFATLKNLDLTNLPELIGKPLWKYEYDRHQKQQQSYTPIRIDWLSNLTNLELVSCDKIESVFSAPVARGLVQLQNIFIYGCKLIEAVVVPGEGRDIYEAGKVTIEEEIIFPTLKILVIRSCPCISNFCKVRTAIKMPQLKMLDLYDLPEMTSFCLPPTTAETNNDPIIQYFFNQVVFAALKELKLINLPELIGKPLWKYEYNHHQEPQEGSGPIKIDWLSNLTDLNLQLCDKVESVFTAPVARGLVQLQKIFIFNCELIEAVVIPSEGGEEEEIMFPKLQELYLENLRCFSSFSKVNAAIKMPKLKILGLWDLPKMSSLCLPSTTTNSNHCPVIQSCFNKVVFAALKELKLINLPKLIGKPLWKYEYNHHQEQQEGSGPIKIDWLSNLTDLNLQLCDKVESVFTAPVARGLVQLQKIFIDRCELLEAIVIPSEGGDIHNVEKGTIGGGGGEEEEIMFPKLQELYLWDSQSFSSFSKVSAAIKMPKLKILQFRDVPKVSSLCLPSMTTNSDHCPVIQSCFNKVILTSIEELELSLMDNLVEIWPKELQVPPKLRNLRVRSCPQLLNGDLLPLNWMQCGMKYLKDIYVKECQFVEIAFNVQELTTTVEEFGISDPVVALPMLVNLNLIHLPKLTHVWKITATSPSSFQGFQNLTSIKIKGCNSLRHLFPTCVAKLLPSLKKLKILECEAMEAIFAVEDPRLDDHDNEGTSSSSMVVLLPQLEVLKLIHLPNLRSLSPQGFTFPGTRLKKLTISCCPYIEQHCWGNVNQVEIIPKPTDIHLLDGKVIVPNQDGGAILVRGMEEPTDTWYKKVEEEVQGHLREANKISFVSCGELLSVASANLMERMPNLRCLEAWDCNSMEAVFDLIGFDSKVQSVSQLEELILEYLPKLTHVWKNTVRRSNSYFRDLRSLKVKNCDSLKYIFTVSMAKALVNLEELTITRCEKVEKIVAWDEGGKGEKEEEEETRELFTSLNLIEVKNLPNLICIGPEEDDGQFLATKDLDVRVIFCRKYRGFRSK